MITLTAYQCELCFTTYPTAPEALRCETHGLPAPAPWFPLGIPVPGFGESGVRWATFSNAYIINRGYGHEWALDGARGDTHLSHNQDPEGSILLAWYDPREGFDPFRYGATVEELEIWEGALLRYGMREEDCDEYVREKVAAARAGLGKTKV